MPGIEFNKDNENLHFDNEEVKLKLNGELILFNPNRTKGVGRISSGPPFAEYVLRFHKFLI